MKSILDTVTNHNGCKLTELPVLMYEQGDGPFDLSDMVDSLIESGDLVAVNYVLPDLPYREKTFLLPKGSLATIQISRRVMYVRVVGSPVKPAMLEDSHAPRRFGPRPENSDCSVPCPACGEPFVTGDYTTLVPLGPGKDKEAQEKANMDRFYNAVAVEVHWTCAGGL